jgi:hypothetical protein
MEVGGQLHVFAVLPPGNSLPVSVGYEDGCASELGMEDMIKKSKIISVLNLLSTAA